MQIEEYRSNSYRSKEAVKTGENQEPEKRVSKIVKSARTKKKSGLRKLADIFVSEDIASVKSYIVWDVVIPLIKKAVSDTVDIVLYGEARNRKKPSSTASYSSYYERNRDAGRDRDRRSRINSEFEDVVVDTRTEAQEILDEMEDLLVRYNVVRVADLYEMAGIDGYHTANRYGWTDIRSARIERLRDGGYLIQMPRPMPLD